VFKSHSQKDKAEQQYQATLHAIISSFQQNLWCRKGFGLEVMNLQHYITAAGHKIAAKLSDIGTLQMSIVALHKDM
jgi:hypothetical protein